MNIYSRIEETDTIACVGEVSTTLSGVGFVVTSISLWRVARDMFVLEIRIALIIDSSSPLTLQVDDAIHILKSSCVDEQWVIFLTTAPCAPIQSFEQLRRLCILLCSRRACYLRRTRICLLSLEMRKGSGAENGHSSGYVDIGTCHSGLQLINDSPGFEQCCPYHSRSSACTKQSRCQHSAVPVHGVHFGTCVQRTGIVRKLATQRARSSSTMPVLSCCADIKTEIVAIDGCGIPQANCQMKVK